MNNKVNNINGEELINMKGDVKVMNNNNGVSVNNVVNNNMKGGVTMMNNGVNTNNNGADMKGGVNMMNVAINNLKVVIGQAERFNLSADLIELANGILLSASVGESTIDTVQTMANALRIKVSKANEELEREELRIEAELAAIKNNEQLAIMQAEMARLEKIAAGSPKKNVPTPKAPQNQPKEKEVKGKVTKKLVQQVINDIAKENSKTNCMAKAKLESTVKVEISSRYVVQQIKKLIMKNKYISHLAIELDETKEGVSLSSVGYSSAPLSRIYDAQGLPIEDSITIPAGNNGVRTITKDNYAPFVKHIISVKFRNTSELNTVATKQLAVYWNGADTQVFTPCHGGWRDIITHNDIKELPKEARLFSTISYSASDIRTGGELLLDITEEDNRAEYLNDGSQGAFEILDGKKMDKIKVMKTMPRFGQLQAGSVNFGAMPNWAYYTKPFINKKGKQVFDGTVYVLDEYIADIISKRLGMKVSAKAVRGMFLQIRPATLKCAALVVSREFIQNVMGNLDKKAINEYGSFDKYDVPVMLADSNAVKLDFDFTQMPDFHVLDIAQSSTANTSKQMLEKLLTIDPTATKELIMELASTQIMGKLVDQIFKRKASIPTPGQIDKGYISDLVLSLAPDYVLKNKSMFRNVVENMIQGLVNNLDKIKFEIEGTNARLTSDPCELLGLERVIKYGEGYLPHAAKYMKANGLTELTVSMFKYPTMGTKEYYQFKALTLDEIRKRIGAMDAPKETKRAAIDMYASLHDGVAILPALLEIMSQCAGLDYDYDGGTFVYNVALNNILSKVDEEIVYIVNDDAKSNDSVDKDIAAMENGIEALQNAKWTFNIDAMGNAYIELIDNGNKSVGYITNLNTTNIALSLLERVGRLDEAVDAIKEGFKTKGGINKYVGLVPKKHVIDGIERNVYIVNSSKRSISRLIEEIKAADLNDSANIYKIYEDLNRVYRAYQELTIDAAKKAYKVEIEAIISHVKALSLLKLTHEVDVDSKKFEIKRLPNTSKKSKEFVDLMSMIQDHVAKVFTAGVNKVLATEVSMSIEEAARLEGYSIAKNKAVIADLTNTVKYSYGAIVGEYAEKRKEANALESTMLADIAKEEFNTRVATLTNLVRKMTSDMSPIERASIMMLISASGNDGSIDRSSTNQMAINLVREEFLMMVMEQYAQHKVCGYKVLVDKGLEVGTKYDFVFGQASNGSLLDFKGEEQSTGNFEIIEFNGVKYAVKPIVITVPQVENKVAFAIKKTSKGFDYETLSKSLSNGKSVTVTVDHKLVVDDQVVAEIKSEVLGKGISELVAGTTGTVSNVIYSKVGRTAFVVELDNVIADESIDNNSNDFEIVGVDGEAAIGLVDGDDIPAVDFTDDVESNFSAEDESMLVSVEDLF